MTINTMSQADSHDLAVSNGSLEWASPVSKRRLAPLFGGLLNYIITGNSAGATRYPYRLNNLLAMAGRLAIAGLSAVAMLPLLVLVPAVMLMWLTVGMDHLLQRSSTSESSIPSDVDGK